MVETKLRSFLGDAISRSITAAGQGGKAASSAAGNQIHEWWDLLDSEEKALWLSASAGIAGAGALAIFHNGLAAPLAKGTLKLSGKSAVVVGSAAMKTGLAASKVAGKVAGRTAANLSKAAAKVGFEVVVHAAPKLTKTGVRVAPKVAKTGLKAGLVTAKVGAKTAVKVALTPLALIYDGYQVVSATYKAARDAPGDIGERTQTAAAAGVTALVDAVTLGILDLAAPQALDRLEGFIASGGKPIEVADPTAGTGQIKKTALGGTILVNKAGDQFRLIMGEWQMVPSHKRVLYYN